MIPEYTDSETHHVELEIEAWGVSWIIQLSVTERWSSPVVPDAYGCCESYDLGIDVEWDQVDWYADSKIGGKTIRVGGTWGAAQLERMRGRPWWKLVGLVDEQNIRDAI